MVESMVLKKSNVASPAASIDSAVVSSVRRDLFRDKLKCWSKAWLFTMGRLVEFVFFFVREIPHHMDQMGTTSTSPGSLRIRPKGILRTSL